MVYPQRHVSPRDGSHGSTYIMVTVTLVIIAALATISLFLLRRGPAKTGEAPLLCQVERGPFEQMVLEQGEVESSQNVEIRCEVKSGTSGGMVILEVVDEGTWVEKGDLLVKLDSSVLVQDQQQQQIMSNTTAALVTQAKSEHDTAVISKTEYLEGTFVQEEQVILNEIYVAEDALKKAELDLASGRRLLAKGLLTRLQLDGQKSAVAKSKNELDAAKTKLRVLRNFTRAKMLKQLEADIVTSKAKWESEQSSHRLELDRLKDIQEQIDKCTIRAPQAGTLVHANVYSRRGGTEFVVEPGAKVREQQVIVRLPDPAHMQVKARINESRIALIKPGMPVAIRLDALNSVGDIDIHGVVERVNQYAEPGGWSTGNVKEYATYIQISDPPKQLRSGFNAEVRILVEHLPDALMVPVQTLYERDGQFFCLVQQGDDWDTRQVTVGSTNDKMIIIKDNLQENEKVVLNPRRHANLLNLPDPPETPAAQLAAVKSGTSRKGGSNQFAGRSTPRPTVDGTAPVSDKEPSKASPPQRGGGRPDPATIAGFILHRFDTDQNGQLSAKEIQQLPAGRGTGLENADTSGDGSLDRAELVAALARQMQSADRQPAAGGEGE